MRENVARKVNLDRQAVLEAALQLVDQDGLDALTMRRLAERLGVAPMALYNHVEGKDDLRDGIVGLVWEQVELPPEGTSWEEVAEAIAQTVRQIAHRHPNVFPLQIGRQVLPPNTLRFLDRLLDALRSGGFNRETAGLATRAIVSYAIGYALAEVSGFLLGVESGDEDDIDHLLRLARAVPRAELPHFLEVAETIAECDEDRQFQFGLELLVEGLAAQLPG